MNPNYSKQSNWLVYISLLVALMIGIIPFDERLKEFMPNLLLMVIIYWAIYRPDEMGLGVAWAIGFFQDIISVSLLGQHSLIYVAVVFIIKSNSDRIRINYFFGHIFWIISFIIFDVVMAATLNWSMQHTSPQLNTIYSVAVSIMIWPWLYLILSFIEIIFSQLRH